MSGLAALPWVELIGWAGSILVVWSLMQARLLRFRWMNLVGSLLATAYNAWAGIWAFVAMNGAIAIIDAYWIQRLQREARSGAGYGVLSVPTDDAYLRHLLGVHRADIAATQPGFDPDAMAEPSGRYAWLVLRGDEAVGAVIVRDAGVAASAVSGPGVAGMPDAAGAGAGTRTAIIELDWVTPRFRDFTPGRFVHRDSGIFTDLGFTRVEVPDAPTNSHPYLRRVGFAPMAGTQERRWERELSPPG